MEEHKIPKVGDMIIHDGHKFIVSDIKISKNPITGTRIVNIKEIIYPY